MLMRCGIFLFTFFACLSTIFGDYDYDSMEFRIIGDDICKKQCKTRVHTICDEVVKTVKECPFKLTEVYDMEKFVETNIKKLIVMGHNGLRNRIADRMHVSDMAEMKWDYDLEAMAKNYAALCQPFENDECVSEKYNFTSNEKFKIIKTKDKLEKYIGQNRYCTIQPYFPRNLVELALTKWYFEKIDLAPPVVRRQGVGSKETIFKKLTGLNNFTVLSYAALFRFGCSVARYDNVYCMFCFYFPYFYNEGNFTTYKVGKPASDCPPLNPLPSEMFSRLCSDGTSIMDDVNTCVKFRENFGIISICIFIVYLCFQMFL